MLIIILSVLGICFGSFINALVWRVHEQSLLKKSKSKVYKDKLEALSITKGRSMCPDCKHILGPLDLVPVLSWTFLRGRCRYCHETISAQYPLVELLVGSLFVTSYICWPVPFDTAQTIIFVLWLTILIGLVALAIYYIRWQLLPNRILYPVAAIALMSAIVTVTASSNILKAIISLVLAVIVGGCIFYALYQFSKGKWIGGGDVRLGWLLGLVVDTPGRAFLLLFIASLAGTVVSLPLLFVNKIKRSSNIPFGPFLIIAVIIVELFGRSILNWYQRKFLGFSI